MKFSVVIPCFNAADTLKDQLKALFLQCQSRDWEIIIADNGSTDGTLEIAKMYGSLYTNLRIVDASDRRGPSHARNIGARVATGDALLFCDADDQIASGWVAAMEKALQKYDFVASRFDSSLLSSPRSLAAKGNKRQQKGLIIYNYVSFLPYAGSSGLGVKRSIHNAVGGFNEDMTACEDCDYCWKIQLSGTTLHFVPEALVFTRHKEPGSGLWRQARNWGMNNALLNKKYRPLGMPRAPMKTGLKLWYQLFRGFPKMIRFQDSRDRWIWNASYRFGQLIGCIKFRVLAL